MIVFPSNTNQWQVMSQFLHEYAHVAPSGDLQMCAWVVDNQIKLVVGLNGFMGRVCQIHVAMAPGFHFTPKEMLKAVFKHAFETCERDLLIGVVNSRNEAAMKYDNNLGFEEMYRIRNMHDDGGDIVILGLQKSACRWLEEPQQKELANVH